MVLLLIIIIQLPFFITGMPITMPEIEWHTLGNKLMGGAELYVDIYYPVGPLSGLFYWMLSILFFNSYFIYKLIALILILVQSVIFNSILINNKAYNQNTYVPAVVYSLLMMSIEDFSTLSPQLISLTFILIGIDLTFQQIEGRKKEDLSILKIGLYYGISMLIYPPSFLFIFPTIISFLIFTNTLIRRYLLLLLGFFLPFVLMWIKFFWFGQLKDFNFNFWFALWPVNYGSWPSWKHLVGTFLIPIIYFTLSFLKVSMSTAFINYQVRLQKFMLLMLFFACIIVFVDYHKTSHILVIFIPFLAFFISHLFLLIRKRFLSELFFIIFTTLLILQNYMGSFGWLPNNKWFDIRNQYYMEDVPVKHEMGQKILVLGDNINFYYKSELGTPYLSWNRAEKQFSNMDQFDVVLRVFENFNNDLPEIIYDQNDRIPELFRKIPKLKKNYKYAGNQMYIKNSD
jgi:hypothetical protein